ncbi:MAG: glycoside hydrolase family 15 protein [Chloroflexota bacterium]
MPRDLPLSNGSLLVNFDGAYNLRDVYYPHVGQENQTAGRINRFGVWVDGLFSWVSDSPWERRLRYEPDTLVSEVHCRHHGIDLELVCHDTVDYIENMMLRHVIVHNPADKTREVRLFWHHDFCLAESASGNTVYYDGPRQALVHYKRDRYFVIGTAPSFAQFATGAKGLPGVDGTWRDAEDGRLSGNPIATGSVDSILGVHLSAPPGGSVEAFQWLAAGSSLGQAAALHELVQRSGPSILIERSRRYWRLWVSQSRAPVNAMPDEIARLYRRCLLIVRTQVDNNGAIIAANDGDIGSFGQDTYSYVWPRDAAIVACVLDDAGYPELARQFFRFCLTLLDEANYHLNGYLMHRYTPTGQVASSWHPGVGDQGLQLPIQEDETALIVYALWHHWRKNRPIELMRPLYERLVRPAADFMMLFRDQLTGLPHESYDLWEEKYGVSLFTCAVVYAALLAAADLAEAFGDALLAGEYREGAAEVKAGVASEMYHPALGRFVYLLRPNSQGKLEPDLLLDSSMAAIWVYDLFAADDPRVQATMRDLIAALANRTPVGGMARHEEDYYHHVNNDYLAYPGNPWFVSTLWLADWHIARAQSPDELRPALALLEWTASHALESGVLAEQIHPHTGAPLSVSPLTWSHAAFVATVQNYLDRQAQLERQTHG